MNAAGRYLQSAVSYIRQAAQTKRSEYDRLRREVDELTHAIDNLKRENGSGLEGKRAALATFVTRQQGRIRDIEQAIVVGERDLAQLHNMERELRTISKKETPDTRLENQEVKLAVERQKDNERKLVTTQQLIREKERDIKHLKSDLQAARQQQTARVMVLQREISNDENEIHSEIQRLEREIQERNRILYPTQQDMQDLEQEAVRFERMAAYK